MTKWIWTVLGLAVIFVLGIFLWWSAPGVAWRWRIAAIVIALGIGAGCWMAIHHYTTMHERIRIERKR